MLGAWSIRDSPPGLPKKLNRREVNINVSIEAISQENNLADHLKTGHA